MAKLQLNNDETRNYSLGDEVIDLQFFSYADIPWDNLAFPSTYQALRALKSLLENKKDKQIEKNERSICIDLDGVISDISKGYKGSQFFGSIIPGAKEAIDELSSLGWKIIIYTSRDDIFAIEKYLRDNHIIYDFINQSHPELQPSIKPLADIYLDDKGITFFGDWKSTVSHILSFSPWYQDHKENHNDR